MLAALHYLSGHPGSNLVCLGPVYTFMSAAERPPQHTLPIWLSCPPTG